MSLYRSRLASIPSLKIAIRSGKLKVTRKTALFGAQLVVYFTLICSVSDTCSFFAISLASTRFRFADPSTESECIVSRKNTYNVLFFSLSKRAIRSTGKLKPAY